MKLGKLLKSLVGPSGYDAVYVELRQKALAQTAANLKIDHKWFGIVMDWPIAVAMSTLVAFRNGEASLYWSTGGGIIGGGQHESVQKAVEVLFRVLDEGHIEAAHDAGAFGDRKQVKFMFLTEGGLYACSATVNDLMKEEHPMNYLWLASQQVIGEIRKIDETAASW